MQINLAIDGQCDTANKSCGCDKVEFQSSASSCVNVSCNARFDGEDRKKVYDKMQECLGSEFKEDKWGKLIG